MRWKNGFWLLLGLGVLLSGCRSLPLRELIFVTPTPRPGGAAARPAGPTPTLPPLPAGLEEEEQRLIAIYQKVLPSVVNIDVEGVETSVFGSGSGFVYDTQGHIVTNNHVVEQAEEIWVTFYDGTVARAGLRGGTREVRVRGASVRLGGDIITAIDGHPVASFDELVSYLVNHTEVGQTVTLTILRDGQEQQVQVTLGERPSP
jgi:S1-C subfamily serine protease